MCITPLSYVLAQVQEIGGLFFWSLVLIGIVLIAAAAVMYLRRWFGKSDSGPIGGFTLGDLRALHRSGQMTDEEFGKARDLIIGRARAEADETTALRDGIQNADAAAGVQLKERSDGPQG